MSIAKTYRSTCGAHYFWFRFQEQGQRYGISCTRHPPLAGRDASTSLTHLYPSGEICFVAGKEPRTLADAEARAAEWAEYLLEYIRSGVAQ